MKSQNEHVALLPTTGEHTGKGWLKILESGDYKEHTGDLTLEDFTSFLKKLYSENYPNDANFLEYPKHHTWEKNGVKYSSWEISKGVFTGDGGMELFNEIVEEELKNLPFKFFLKESSHDKPIT